MKKLMVLLIVSLLIVFGVGWNWFSEDTTLSDSREVMNNRKTGGSRRKN